MSEAEFKDAYGNARRLNGASTDEQLSLYAWAKIAEGQTQDKPRPGVFDFAGRKKWDKWDELSKAGLTQEEARKNYVDKFNELKSKHGLKDA